MPQYDEQLGELVVDDAALDRLAARDLSPLSAIESVRQLVNAVDVDRWHEAQPMMPMATLSVTEDMATCMRLHAMGWRSVYHHEVLAHGLAPDDLGTMLQQRLRWAQGTLQVMLKENPLVQKGLSIPQRLMYFSTMWSYLSGFAAVVFLAAPVHLPRLRRAAGQGLRPDLPRLLRALHHRQPAAVLRGRLRPKTWRGHQFSLALFPLWIRACWTAAANVWFHRPLGFVVTPKTAQDEDRPLPVAPRAPRSCIAAVLLLLAVVIGGRATVDWARPTASSAPASTRCGSPTTSSSSASSGGPPSTGAPPQPPPTLEKEHTP